MRLQVLSALAAALLLAACASESATTDNAAGSGNATAAMTIEPGSQEDLVKNVGDRVFFATDRYDLSADAQAQLQKQAAWLQQYPKNTVTIEGHCDERGTREYNLALGERRANAVANYLVALGVDKARVSTISYGKERPEALCSDESCWSQNRRGVTTVNK